MKKINATIERTIDGSFTVTATEKVAGCWFAGYGNSVPEAKEDFFIGIQESIEAQKELGKEVNIKSDDIEVNFQYDIPSFFNDFDWINVSKFAQFAGVNESKMRAYKLGMASASEKTLTKITEAVKTIASTMAAISL